MASINLSHEANGSRLSRLLIDKGTQAMRATFDFYCQPDKLTTVLNANKHILKRLRYKVITRQQWPLLYPSDGAPNSKNFDITLLTILLRNICGLRSPATGWKTMPPDADSSVTANILRIKLYRNDIYAHITSTEVDGTKFEILWQKISAALISLGIPSHEINDLKDARLSPEEDGYIQKLIRWKQSEDELIMIAQNTLEKVSSIQAMIEKQQREANENCKGEGILRCLSKCDFKGSIKNLAEKFQTGTREWLFHHLDSWFSDKESNSRLMILTAGPGIGKSVFAAKVCQVYQERGQLAACHFCKFNYSDYKNPHTLLQSLASHLCENVEGFKEKLLEQLQRPHSKEMLPDAFRVLLNDPLHALDDREPMMIVIDALDESEADGKSELLELISEEFPKLPKWIKILITSRPELPVQKSLNHLNPVEILPDHESNDNDILFYLKKSSLSNRYDRDEVLKLLVWKCEGSFLFAFYLQLELHNEDKVLKKENVRDFVPKGISGFYEKQFKRLKAFLDKLAPSKMEFKRFLEVLVAAKGPLPMGLLQECLSLSKNTDYELRQAINETMSSFLPVYDDCLTVYHRSLVEWLTSSGYSEHAFTSDAGNGTRYIWSACEKELKDLTTLETFSHLKMNPVMKYALQYGTSHMIDVGDENQYHWLVDIKINHIKFSIFPGDLRMLEEDWEFALKRLTRWNYSIWQHLNYLHCLCLDYEGIISGSYLQSVANGLIAINDEEGDKCTAKSLLKRRRHVWCEDLNLLKDPVRPLRVSGFNAVIQCVGVSPNMQLAAIGHGDGKISILGLPNLEILYTFNSEFTSNIPCCTFSADNCTLLYGRLDSCLSVKRHEKLSFFSGNSEKFLSCSFSACGKKLVTANDTRSVKVWDVSNQILLTCLDVEGPVDDCFFSKCGLFIVARRKRGKIATLAVWNVLTLQRVDQRYSTHNVRIVSSPYYSSDVHWFSSATIADKNRGIASTGGPRKCPEFHQLPQGFHLGYVHGLKRYTVINYENRDCILICDQKTESFKIVDPVQQSVVAECRIPWLRCIDCSPIVLSKESFMVQDTPCLLSFKIPNQLSFLSPIGIVTITCCSFSPDATYFATCDDLGILRIWMVNECKVIQSYPMGEQGIGCWWSDTCLWIVFSTHLAKFPVNSKQEINFSEVKKVPLPFDGDTNPEYLLFSEGVLISKCPNSNNVVVTKIINDDLQAAKRLNTDYSFDRAAVVPGAHTILMASCGKYQVWKERKNGERVWFCTVDRNMEWFEYIDCICTTNKGEIGVIVFLEIFSTSLAYLLLNLNSGEIVNRITCNYNESIDFKTSVYASNSYLIFREDNGGPFWILRLEDGGPVAVLDRPEQITISWNSQHWNRCILGFSAKQNLLAIPHLDGYINFVKIHFPEGTN